MAYLFAFFVAILVVSYAVAARPVRLRQLWARRDGRFVALIVVTAGLWLWAGVVATRDGAHAAAAAEGPADARYSQSVPHLGDAHRL